MSRLRAFLRRGLALAAFACAAIAGQADELRLTLPEARGAAARLLEAGQPEAALMLAEGVLLGAPRDVPGHLLKAKALRDLGRDTEAVEAARAAWSEADGARDRFFSAMMLAQTRSSAGQKGVAQYWLRRAAHIAPDEELKAAAIRDFRHVRRMTPWRLSLDLTLEPSDNLNGAPKTNTFTFAGLPFVNPAAVPLSGMRYGAGIDYVYRFNLGERSRLNLGATLDVERVKFSSAARDKVPGVKNSDYRQDVLGLSLGYERRGAEGLSLGAARVSVQRHWLAGEPLADSVRLDLSHGRAVMPGLIVGGRVGLEKEWRHDVSTRDSRTSELGLNATRRFDHGALRLDLSYADTESDSRSVARETGRAVLSYGLAKPVKGMLPRLALSYETVEYDMGPSVFWVDPREDREWGLSLDVTLPDLDYYGFAPEIGVSFRDRSSNYTLYETRSTDLHLGLKSVF